MRLLTLEIAGSYWSVPMPPTSWCGGADTRVNRAADFIESKYADDITLAQISQASGLSLTQLTQLFQRQTGLTPYAFVVDRRLRQASHLLATSDMLIAHVAIVTGFSDQQHLTRVCRAHLNRTPRQLRYGSDGRCGPSSEYGSGKNALCKRGVPKENPATLNGVQDFQWDIGAQKRQRSTIFSRLKPYHTQSPLDPQSRFPLFH